MEHTHVSTIPDLDHGILVAAFGGWNDAASASTWSVKYLLNQWDAQEFAEIDPEPFYDFSETRPQVRIVRGVIRQLTWPSNRYFMMPPASETNEARRRSVMLFLGEEPQLHWRTFTQEMLDLCRECKIQDIVLLGSLVAEVPHTAPVQISGTSNRSSVIRRMAAYGIEPASYTGGTGILSVVHDAARKEGFNVSGLWGVAPHYISATPNLAVSEALLRKLDMIYGFDLQLKDLTRAAQRFTARVSSLVAEDPDVSAYVHELEQRSADGRPAREFGSLSGSPDISMPSAAEGELPSAEQAIESVEELLRHYREGSGAD
jgi:proteasome assembly chaperone (PAC2) family protein